MTAAKLNIKKHSDKINSIPCLYSNMDSYSNKRRELLLYIKTLEVFPKLIMLNEVNPKHTKHKALESEF